MDSLRRKNEVNGEKWIHLYYALAYDTMGSNFANTPHPPLPTQQQQGNVTPLFHLFA